MYHFHYHIREWETRAVFQILLSWAFQRVPERWHLRRSRVLTPRICLLGNSDYFMLVIFKKQDSGKTFELSPNCLKEFKIKALLQKVNYVHS